MFCYFAKEKPVFATGYLSHINSQRLRLGHFTLLHKNAGKFDITLLFYVIFRNIFALIIKTLVIKHYLLYILDLNDKFNNTSVLSFMGVKFKEQLDCFCVAEKNGMYKSFIIFFICWAHWIVRERDFWWSRRTITTIFRPIQDASWSKFLNLLLKNNDWEIKYCRSI